MKVAVRARGLAPKEYLDGCISCIDVDSTSSTITVGGERSFQFEHAFGPQTTQADVYRRAVSPLLEASFSGTNVTVLAYGASPSSGYGVWPEEET